MIQFTCSAFYKYSRNSASEQGRQTPKINKREWGAT